MLVDEKGNAVTTTVATLLSVTPNLQYFAKTKIFKQVISNQEIKFIQYFSENYMFLIMERRIIERFLFQIAGVQIHGQDSTSQQFIRTCKHTINPVDVTLKMKLFIGKFHSLV